MSVALSTTDRQPSRLAAFLRAEDRPMLKGLKSVSTARSHLCLGRSTGRLQSGGGFWIAAETARWWSWVAKKSQSSICYRKRPTVSDPNFRVGYVSDIWNSKNLAEGPRVKCIDACTEQLRGGPYFAAVHRHWNEIGLI